MIDFNICVCVSSQSSWRMKVYRRTHIKKNVNTAQTAKTSVFDISHSRSYLLNKYSKPRMWYVHKCTRLRMFQTRLNVAYCLLMRRTFNEIWACTFNAAHRECCIIFAICEGNRRLEATCLYTILIISLHDVEIYFF